MKWKRWNSSISTNIRSYKICDRWSMPSAWSASMVTTCTTCPMERWRNILIEVSYLRMKIMINIFIVKNIRFVPCFHFKVGSATLAFPPCSESCFLFTQLLLLYEIVYKCRPWQVHWTRRWTTHSLTGTFWSFKMEPCFFLKATKNNPYFIFVH